MTEPLTLPGTGRDVSFTGTQDGMTLEQRKALPNQFTGWSVLHFGLCVGADYQAYIIATHLGLEAYGYPSNLRSRRVYVPCTREFDPKPPLDRNWDIVRAGAKLVAAPAQAYPVLRSGTWTTIRYAAKLSRPTTVIWPDGRVEHFPNGHQLALGVKP